MHPNHQLTERDTNIMMRKKGGLVDYLILVAIPEDWPFWKKQLVLQNDFV